MMTLQFTKYLKSRGLASVYPNNIPTGDTMSTGVFSYSSKIDSLYGTIGTANFQFLTYGKDLNATEVRSNEVMNFLLNTNFFLEKVGDFEILDLQVLNVSPMYLGVDDELRYRWSFNIALQVKKFK